MDNEKEPITANENLIDGYEQIKDFYHLQTERLKASDEKLNMILVFNAAILALLIAVIPFPIEKTQYILSIVLFAIFIVSMIITVISIFIGLFPRKTNSIDFKNYISAEQYNCTRNQYVGKYISSYEDASESIAKVAEKKQMMIKHSMIETLLNIILMVVLIVIKIIGG